jgi:hypothetical protein
MRILSILLLHKCNAFTSVGRSNADLDDFGSYGMRMQLKHIMKYCCKQHAPLKAFLNGGILFDISPAHPLGYKHPF